MVIREKMRKPGTKKRRVEIKRIENKNALMVTFSKRRSGLFRKTNRLADLYGLDLAMVVFSPGGRAFTTGNLSLVDRYLDQDDTAEGGGAAGHVPGEAMVAVSSSAPTHVPPSLAPETVPQAAPAAAVNAVPMDVQAASSAAPGFTKKGLRGYMRCLEELRRRVVDRMNHLEGKEKAKSNREKAKSNEEKTNAEVSQDPAANGSDNPFRTFL